MKYKELKLAILGEPMAKQSCRFTKTGIKYQPKKITDNSTNTQYQIIQQLPIGFEPFDSELSVDYVFYYSYPKTMLKNKSLLKRISSGEVFYKVSKPDIDNLQKQINDIMNSIVYIDDSRIVNATARKLYSDKPRIELYIQAIK